MASVRFFKKVSFEAVITTIDEDGSIIITETTIHPKVGNIYSFEDMVVVSDNRRYVDIILATKKDNESTVWKNVDTLTFAALGTTPQALIDPNAPKSPPPKKTCCP
jgi:hypothetical protein